MVPDKPSTTAPVAPVPAVPCVLFVDDEPSILNALRRVVRPAGYRILIAEGGEAGLALLAQESVDLVVSDMRMPGMDGAQFLQEVRRRWPKIQRVLLTGYADIGSTIAAINLGEIHRYIAKPWDDQELLLALREGLARRELERENERLQALTQQQNEELTRVNASLEARVKARTAEIEQINAMLEQAYGELERNFLLSMDVFAGLLELRQQGAAGYCRKVANLAKAVAAALKLSPSEQQDVFVAGLLHEVGKISLPDQLLGRPLSTLNAEEQTRVRRHVLAAESALMPLAALQRVARLVRMQHERVDGHGGPDGLQGDDLPLAAQALGVAVEYQAMVHGRLSVKPPSPKEAQRIVAGFKGTHYRAEVTEAFLAVVESMNTADDDRQIDAVELRPGMVLARDLLSAKGNLLLAAGYRFDERVVRQIHEYVRREGSRLSLYIKPFDAAAAPGAARGVAAPETTV